MKNTAVAIYPEIDSLSSRDLKACLGLAVHNIDCIKPESRPQLQARIEYMEERLKRLTKVAL